MEIFREFIQQARTGDCERRRRGLSGKLSGGSFSKSFVSAGFTQAVSPGIDRIGGATLGGSAARIVAGGVVGGAATALAGGRFKDGFERGMLSRGLNDEIHEMLQQMKYGLTQIGQHLETSAKWLKRQIVPTSREEWIQALENTATFYGWAATGVALVSPTIAAPFGFVAAAATSARWYMGSPSANGVTAYLLDSGLSVVNSSPAIQTAVDIVQPIQRLTDYIER